MEVSVIFVMSLVRPVFHIRVYILARTFRAKKSKGIMYNPV